MNLNLDKVPSNLEEAVSLLKDAFDDKEKEILKRTSIINLHMSVGRYIRNEWSLWDKNNVLTQWFKKKYEVDHADDISSIIIECVIADLINRPRQDKELAKQFIEHWEAQEKNFNKKDKDS